MTGHLTTICRDANLLFSSEMAEPPKMQRTAWKTPLLEVRLLIRASPGWDKDLGAQPKDIVS